MLDKIVESCRYLLNNFPEATNCKSYLDSRLAADSQEQFQFGYFPNIEHLQVLIDMVGEDVLNKEKLLFARPIEDSLCPRIVKSTYFDDYPLVMPFRDAYGDIAALVGRSLLSDEERAPLKLSKYKNSKDFKKSQFLFGLYENKKHIAEQNCVYVVEGQFDVIKAVEKGFNNIVGLGTNSMSAYQFSLISRYTDNIFLLLDNDISGEKGRKLIIGKFGKLANIQNFYLPESYKDIDEYFTKSGEDSVSFVVKS